MKKNMLLENLTQTVGCNIPMRRYSLADMISESYKVIYQCGEGTNLRKLAESHLEDVRKNPREIERLSRQLSIIKELNRMVESNDLKDEDLVDEKSQDTVEPKEDRVIVQNECNESDNPKASTESPRKYRRRTKEACDPKKESIKESDDTDLTDEELDELAKHLETIRKERKNATKTEMTEDATPTRRGIKCHIADAKKPKKEELSDRDKSNKVVTEDIDSNSDIENRVNEALSNTIYDIFESYGLDPEEISQDFYYAVDFDHLVRKTATFIRYRLHKASNASESRVYKGLENFKKQSESKAFYKTFKKMHKSLKEGKALTRQESIDLYKAANSALTQMSIELEHNPEFLQTFNESSALLSSDVNSLRESLARGKAPSKKNMKSLAKFSDALLSESMSATEYGDEIKKNKDNPEECDAIYTRAKKELGKGDLDYVTDIYSRYRNLDESAEDEEDDCSYFVYADDKQSASEAEEFYDKEEAIQYAKKNNSYEVEKYNSESGKFTKVWKNPRINESEDEEDIGCQDLPPHVAAKCTAEKAHAKALANREKRKAKKSTMNEEDLPEYAGSFKVVDTIPVGPDHIVQICYIDDTYSENHYGVQVVDNDGNPVEGNREIDDLTYDKLFNTEKEAREVANKLVPILRTKYSVNESSEEVLTSRALDYMYGEDRKERDSEYSEEEKQKAIDYYLKKTEPAPKLHEAEDEDTETPEEDFVGDDEGDMQSEEADAFDQEYADARFELHSDLEAEHQETEDPDIQSKLEQDKDEVINLPGISDEAVAQLSGDSEETTEDGSEESEENEDDSEITDAELEELKKHLKEMRSAKK